jgi:predicted transcriptional regulator
MPNADINAVGLSADIVAAYVANNSIPTSELPSLIASIHATLIKLGKETVAPAPEKLVPAVPIHKSIRSGAIICLEDGRAFKSLKRHLGNKYGLTPEQYRAKWGLPADYPMVAPAYSEARSAFAKAAGLGRKAAKGRRKAA